MLGDSDVGPAIAVTDTNRAKQFYSDKLGLELEAEFPGGLLYKSGNSKLFVYESEFAGTNKATYAGWGVEDVAKTVEALKANGVQFEHYDDLPGTTREGDVHDSGGMKGAWFKDPDGNILSINSGM